MAMNDMKRFLTRNRSKAACPSGYKHVKVGDNLFFTRNGVGRCLNPVGVTVTALSQHPHCHHPSPICCGLQTLSEHRSAHAPSHLPGALSLPAAPGLKAGDSCPLTSPPLPGLLSLLLTRSRHSLFPECAVSPVRWSLCSCVSPPGRPPSSLLDNFNLQVSAHTALLLEAFKGNYP